MLIKKQIIKHNSRKTKPTKSPYLKITKKTI